MSKRITWDDIYKDFAARLPTLYKMAADYCPQDYMTIVVRLKDGTRVTYDALQKRAWFTTVA